MNRLLAVWLMLFVLTIPCLKAQSITAYRYWFDDAFSATAHPASTVNNVFNSSFNTEGVTVGFHIVNMQFRDNNNRWSSVVSEQFYRAKTGIEVSGYEYWFDDDYANAVNKTEVAALNFELNIPISTGTLPTGFHKFNIRFKTQGGDWSTVTTEEFYKAKINTEIEAYQYWFDDDFANAVSKAMTPTGDLDVPISTGSLKEGNHILNIRFKTKGGDWSISTSEEFYKVKIATEIEAYQYWFDDDFSNAILKNMVAIDDLDVPISTTSISDGIHILNMRFKTKGGDWSIPISSEFYRTKISTSITGYQYWFDDDFSNRTTNTIAATTSLNLDVNLNTQTLEQGYHRFNIRFKTENGDWSVPTSEDFYKITVGNNKIVAYRYWFNDNIQNSKTVNLSAPVSSLDLNASIDTKFAPDGANTIHFQFKTEGGDWSVPTSGDYNSNVAKVAGVTVIVHGFAGDGNFPTWVETMATAIKERAGGGSIFKNDPNTGNWMEVGINSKEPNSEIILLYDWAELSRQNTLNLTGFDGNGYLESAADHLFALLNKPPFPLNEKLFDRPIHFIGHSRGTILILQTLHRIRKFFPSVEIEQVTFLDPHPATNFGDVKGSFLLNNVESLPCVQGRAYVCDAVSCLNADEIKINVPDNVSSFDNYYRKDEAYEEFLILNGLYHLELASFDGVTVLGGGSFDRQIINNQLSNTYTVGGAHSAVHAWYYGTIDTSITANYNGVMIDDKGAINSSREWYNPSKAFVNPNIISSDENRRTLGYNRSRLGGKGYPRNSSERVSLSEMETSLNLRTNKKTGLQPVFNGDFQYGDGKAGWTLNGGSMTGSIIDEPSIKNKKLKLDASKLAKHSCFYFPTSEGNNTVPYLYLKFKASIPNAVNTQREIKTVFSDINNNIEKFSKFFLLDPFAQDVYCPLPNYMRNQIITFSVEVISGGETYFDDFELWGGAIPNNALQFNPTQALPIELSYFNGSCTEGYNALKWQTTTEWNNKQFEVQYSPSPQTGWLTIGTLKGKGNSSNINNYNFTHQNISRLSYYRLKQVDTDGKVHYSHTTSVECKGRGHFLKLYPNPTRDFILLETDVTEGVLAIELYNLFGQKIFKKNYDSGIYPIQVSLKDVNQSGTYIVKVFKINGEFIGYQKLIID